jgi:hypothetical protein
MLLSAAGLGQHSTGEEQEEETVRMASTARLGGLCKVGRNQSREIWHTSRRYREE